MENSELISLSRTDLIAGLNDSSTQLSQFANSFKEAFVYRGAKAPAQAIAQVFGSAGSVEDFSPAAPRNSSEYHGQLLGDAAATVTHFLFLKQCGKFLSGNSGAQAIESLSLRKEFLKGAAFGFAYEGLTRPASLKEIEEKGLFRSRLENAFSGAAVFAGMNSTAAMLKNLSTTAESKGFTRIASLLENKPLIGALSGLPGGLISAESSALIKEQRHASWSEINQSVYGMGLVGFGFGHVSRFLESPSTQAAHTESFSHRAAGPALTELILSKAEQFGARVDSLMDRILGPRLQPALAFATDSFAAQPGRAKLAASEFFMTANDNNFGSASEKFTIPQEKVSASPDPRFALIFQNREFAEQQILPKIEQAQARNAVSAVVELTKSMSTAKQLEIANALRKLGYAADIFAVEGQPTELLVSWSPQFCSSIWSLESVLKGKPELSVNSLRSPSSAETAKKIAVAEEPNIVVLQQESVSTVSPAAKSVQVLPESKAEKVSEPQAVSSESSLREKLREKVVGHTSSVKAKPPSLSPEALARLKERLAARKVQSDSSSPRSGVGPLAKPPFCSPSEPTKNALAAEKLVGDNPSEKFGVVLDKSKTADARIDSA
ncbi:MAG: hypothetical protein K2X27_01135, partial [Candidatus Obscuribacterales bacterium]|nr:hypothetical protein [Candidatus Obscuribacterales bacterium]